MDAVKIGNMALSHVGAGTQIESLSENSLEAQQITLWYDEARKQALSALNWTFARKRADLASHTDDPPTEWLYRYQYPVDCLVMRKIPNPMGRTADAVPFKVEVSEDGTSSILTDLGSASAVYTFDNQDPGMYSFPFNLALSYLVGHYIAYVVTGKRQVAAECLQKYLMAVRAAGSVIANEEVPEAPRDSEVITTRG